MSWDYNYNNLNNSFNTNTLGTAYSPNKSIIANLSCQLDKNPSVSSFSSDSVSSVNNMGTEDEAKLLPQNLWGETSKNSNTFEESQFFQNQLQNAEHSWYQKTLEQPLNIPQVSQQPELQQSELQHSQSTQSIFDMKYSRLGQTTQKMNNIGFNYTASTTPVSAATPPIPQLPNPSSPNEFGGFPALNSFNSQNSTSASFSGNTQNLLQNYQQQQQQYLEQQQQQHQLLQSPLFLQQQAQLVSQQLQQLQLQLQIQQQQIENANLLLSKKVELSDKLPLTEENLTKLQQTPAKESLGSESNSNGDKNTVNTELYKTELCSTFQKKGSCPYGSKCQFAHGEHELKHVERGSKWRSKPCAKWAKTGFCRYGNRCCFKHGD